ncbi:MAG TPA: molecular chaperone DnaJ [Gemmatimonadota bacterium]
MTRDYYEVLGVGREADAEEIKRAYRRLAMQHHPDRNPGDPRAEASFKEATEAYEVLRDPQKRSTYDRFGHAGMRGGFAGGADGFDLSDALRAFMRDFGGLGAFEELFGGGESRRAASGPRRGSDVQVRVRLSLEEVAAGAEKTLNLAILETCPACEGTGSETRERIRCPTCGGEGEIRQARRSIFGQFVNVTTCPRCGGSGRAVEKPCPACAGEGRQRKEKRVKVKIPPGVATGNYLTLRGQGNVGANGGPHGNVIVVVEVLDHEVFQRDDDDVLLEQTIPFTTAALGGPITVPTLEGPAELAVPAGTQSGQVLSLKGRGIPRLSAKGRGDLRVHVRVWTPTKLSAEERRLLDELSRSENLKPPAARGTFWEKMKEVFSA